MFLLIFLPLLYPNQCQWYTGTLTSARGMQVPLPVSGACRYPNQCQGHAGTLTGVRGMPVPLPVSGVYRNRPNVSLYFPTGCGNGDLILYSTLDLKLRPETPDQRPSSLSGKQFFTLSMYQEGQFPVPRAALQATVLIIYIMCTVSIHPSLTIWPRHSQLYKVNYLSLL